MTLEDPSQTLLSLRDELDDLPADPYSSRSVSWRLRCRSALTRFIGADHYITKGFLGISWSPAYATSTFATDDTIDRARGYLDAAAHEAGVVSSTAGALDASGVDPELWEHVASYIAAEDWGTVASQTAIFTEDRIRRWTGQLANVVGRDLMTAAVGNKGAYRLGLVSGEQDGWHLLGMGILMALRNADAHRIQTRPDHRPYAMGVVGVSSLLLTQLRYEHGNRFHDTAPVPALPADPNPTSGDPA